MIIYVGTITMTLSREVVLVIVNELVHIDKMSIMTMILNKSTNSITSIMNYMSWVKKDFQASNGIKSLLYQHHGTCETYQVAMFIISMCLMIKISPST